MNMPADIATLRRINDLVSDRVDTAARLAALQDANWQIQQAACNGLTEHPDAAAIPALHDLLVDQDARDLYSTEEWDYEPVNAATELDHRNRFRLKQAALIALKRIAAQHPLPDSLVDRLCRYATDALEDYPVRAAAADVLAHCPGAAVIAALETTAADTEWCTATTARRALATQRR